MPIFLGIVLFIVGILGFVPELVHSGHLFGIFRFNFEDRIGYMSIGILGILCGFYSLQASKIYLIAIGLFYGLLSLLGFYQGDGMLLGMFTNNLYGSYFNGAIALFAFSQAYLMKNR